MKYNVTNQDSSWQFSRAALVGTKILLSFFESLQLRAHTLQLLLQAIVFSLQLINSSLLFNAASQDQF